MLQIDVLSRVPVYEQIIDQIETLIATGAMKAGDQLPSVRGLSVEILVNPNTIQKAYTELDNLGIVTSVPGRGCFVSQNAPEMLRRRGTESLSELYALAKRLHSLGVRAEELHQTIDEAVSGKTADGTGKEG